MAIRIKKKSKKIKDVERKWYLIDASNKILGRFSVRVANILRGKEKPDFSYHKDNGNFIIVINTSRIMVSGKKKIKKIYYRHSGYLGHLKGIKLGELLEKRPEELLRRSVFNMLPKNKLRAKWMRRLKIYKNDQHLYRDKKLIKHE